MGSMSAPEQELEQLNRRRVQLEADMVEIRQQLEKLYIQGPNGLPRTPDPDWRVRAQAALRYKGAEHQNVLRRIGQLGRQVRRQQQSTVEKAFLEIARELLAPAIFHDILTRAVAASKQDPPHEKAKGASA